MLNTAAFLFSFIFPLQNWTRRKICRPSASRVSWQLIFPSTLLWWAVSSRRPWWLEMKVVCCPPLLCHRCRQCCLKALWPSLFALAFKWVRFSFKVCVLLAVICPLCTLHILLLSNLYLLFTCLSDISSVILFFFFFLQHLFPFFWPFSSLILSRGSSERKGVGKRECVCEFLNIHACVLLLDCAYMWIPFFQPFALSASSSLKKILLLQYAQFLFSLLSLLLAERVHCSSGNIKQVSTWYSCKCCNNNA